MLRRALVFLLLACLAAPGMAMTGHCLPMAAPQDALNHECAGHEAREPQAARHDAPAATLMPGDHSGHEGPAGGSSDGTATGQQDCIGCTAPLHGTAPVAAAWAWRQQPAIAAPLTSLAGTTAAPETPPPRA